MLLCPGSRVSPVPPLNLLEQRQAIGTASDTPAWMEKEWDIELGLKTREWEGRRETKTHIRSLWVYVLNGCNPNLHHFIMELMAFKGG